MQIVVTIKSNTERVRGKFLSVAGRGKVTNFGREHGFHTEI
jgi:hypothetical protein